MSSLSHRIPRISSAASQAVPSNQEDETELLQFPAASTLLSHLLFRPGDPCPDLLTDDDTVKYLRLDSIDIKNPKDTLQRYRKEGLLKGTQVSKKVFYLRRHLDEFLEKMTIENPR